ncbi:hypothetical protein G6F22_014529 [Rhizopus arrhizus]|nr:hypothetical protein G6F22_014529 [Rhizopus arrhizus]
MPLLTSMYLGDRWEYLFRTPDADPANTLALRAYGPEGREPGPCRLALPASKPALRAHGRMSPRPGRPPALPSDSCYKPLARMPGDVDSTYNASVQRPDSPSTLSRYLRWLGAPAQHYLRIGIAISLLVHAGALAWRFGAPAFTRPPVTSLEVVLLNARSETPPDTPRAQAQNQMSGGGNADRGMTTTPLPQTGASAETIVLEAMRRRQVQLEAEQTRLMTQLRSQEKAGVERQAVNPWPDGTD